MKVIHVLSTSQINYTGRPGQKYTHAFIHISHIKNHISKTEVLFSRQLKWQNMSTILVDIISQPYLSVVYLQRLK